MFEDGSGISADSGVSIELKAAGDNTITYLGDGDHDGINAGANNTGGISLQGANNTIKVLGNDSDGIYTDTGSHNNTDLIAESGNNTIIAGNNGIDHRGDGTVKLQAHNGSNIIHAGEGQTGMEGDGIRVAGSGDVTLDAQYNEIIGHDEGIYTDVANSQINITATGVDENGIGNYIKGEDNGIEVVGRKITSTSPLETLEGASQVVITAEKGANKIEAGQKGITVNGTNNVVTLNGDTNTIKVTGATSSTGIPSAGTGYQYVYGIQATENGKVEIKNINTNDTAVSEIILNDVHGAVRGIHAAKGGQVDIEQNSLNINIHRLDGTHEGNAEEQAEYVYGIVANVDTTGNPRPQIGNNEDTSIDITTVRDLNVSVASDADAETAAGVYASDFGQIHLTSQEGTLNVNVNAVSKENGGQTSGIWSDRYSSITTSAKNGIDIDVTNVSDVSNKTVYGVRVNVSNTGAPVEMLDAGTIIFNTEGDLSVDAHAGKNSSASGLSSVSYSAATSGGEIRVEQADNMNITASGKTAYALNATTKGKNTVTSQGNVNLTVSSVEGSSGGTIAGVYSFNGNNIVTTDGNIHILAVGQGNDDNARGIHTFGNGTTGGSSNLTGADISITAQNDDGTAAGIYAEGSGNAKVSLTATTGDNTITSDQIGIYSTAAGTDVLLNAEAQDNVVNAGELLSVTYGNAAPSIFGNAEAVQAVKGSTVTLHAANGNRLAGAVFASGTDTFVTVNGFENTTAKNNEVYSASIIENAGNLKNDNSDKFNDTDVISALYAEDGATIVVSGERNEFRSYAADPSDTGTLERTVWAYDGANIEINGSTLISTDRYDETLTAQQGNSADIAIAAGTAVNLTNEQVLANADPKSTVTLNYGAGSSITGDILSAYAGQVDIQAQDGSDAGISVKGNILAGNNGVLNIDLGKGGYLEGRADDYGDAGLNTTGEDNIDQGHATHEFFNPAFSSTIFKGGEVNFSMGEGSRWNVTGQSWVTRINTESAALADDVLAAENPVEAMNHMATIDLVEANTDRNTNAHALTVYEMTGDAVFNMSLDADRDVSDMLYMKSANGDYIINVVDAVTLDDMYAEGFDGLRFATVGEGSNVSFRAVTVGQGVFNVEYEVGTDAYANNDENHAYNGGESVSEDKPGSDLVDGFFESTQEPGAAETQASRKRMRMAAMAMPAAANDGIMLLDDTAAADDTAAVDGSVDETTNFKLIGRKDESTSNAGKTIIAMSKVNYSNAVYMDRLNKRMGEARYIDGDEGLWVRMRHDRIGKSDAFRSKNTMFELGYDRKVGDREDGEHRQGVVFDYMRGTADYHNVAGEGDVRRGGVWFYDTWLGNKGHYTDYVLKFGRLSNDFDIYSELGEKITGDYSNFVYSASAEYGRKKSLGGDWYIEPQAQLQYAHVTDADYTTSQGTSVQLDAIDSLIGRVGFRLGKDVSDTSTFYIKADVLHEFLGDQDISAFDATGRLDTTYENEGTWYDVGLGFSHQFSKGTYMFLDVEKTFGNDNEDTYQFNVGMNWKV